MPKGRKKNIEARAIFKHLVQWLVERRFPHVMNWHDREKNQFFVLFLHKRNKKFRAEHLVLFKAFDSIFPIKAEKYRMNKTHDSDCKKRCHSNLQKLCKDKYIESVGKEPIFESIVKYVYRFVGPSIEYVDKIENQYTQNAKFKKSESVNTKNEVSHYSCLSDNVNIFKEDVCNVLTMPSLNNVDSQEKKLCVPRRLSDIIHGFIQNKNGSTNNQSLVYNVAKNNNSSEDHQSLVYALAQNNNSPEDIHSLLSCNAEYEYGSAYLQSLMNSVAQKEVSLANHQSLPNSASQNASGFTCHPLLNNAISQNESDSKGLQPLENILIPKEVTKNMLAIPFGFKFEAVRDDISNGTHLSCSDIVTNNIPNAQLKIDSTSQLSNHQLQIKVEPISSSTGLNENPYGTSEKSRYILIKLPDTVTISIPEDKSENAHLVDSFSVDENLSCYKSSGLSVEFPSMDVDTSGEIVDFDVSQGQDIGEAINEIKYDGSLKFDSGLVKEEVVYYLESNDHMSQNICSTVEVNTSGSPTCIAPEEDELSMYPEYDDSFNHSGICSTLKEIGEVGPRVDSDESTLPEYENSLKFSDSNDGFFSTDSGNETGEDFMDVSFNGGKLSPLYEDRWLGSAINGDITEEMFAFSEIAKYE